MGDSEYSDQIEKKQVDFGQQSDLYAKYRPGFPDSYYERLELYLSSHFYASSAKIDPQADFKLKILDLGTGPGVIALELAKRYPNSSITAMDISANQIKYAQILAKERNLENNTNFLVCSAETITQLTGHKYLNYFDIVICGQCWPWFKPEIALVEIHNVLKSRGLLVIAHYCYSPLTSGIARDSEKLVLQLNPTWDKHSFNGMYPKHVDMISKQYNYGEKSAKHKYEFVNLFCFDHDQKFTVESWVGRMLTCNGVGSGTLDNVVIEKFKTDMTKILKGNFAPCDANDTFLKQFVGKYNFEDKQVFTVKHRVWCSFAMKVTNSDSKL